MALTEARAAFWTAKTIAGLVIALALGVGIALFGGHYAGLQRAAAVGEHRGGVLQNATAGVEDGTKLDAQQEAYNQGLAAGRESFQRTNREAQRNEPETASRAGRTVPDSLRSAYRERRRARERLGCAGEQCAQDDRADAAAER